MVEDVGAAAWESGGDGCLLEEKEEEEISLVLGFFKGLVERCHCPSQKEEDGSWP